MVRSRGQGEESVDAGGIDERLQHLVVDWLGQVLVEARRHRRALV
jgi:hypothetical protein